MGDDAHGHFGGDLHYALIKQSVMKVIDRYYDQYSRVTIENRTLTLGASSGSGSLGGIGARYHHEKDIRPDVAFESEPGKTDGGMESKKLILVEAETRPDGLLADRHRLAAYDLLRQACTDRNKLMLYIAVPESKRDRFEKPDAFNDIWSFPVGDV